jgi:hypothetical protein
MENINEGIIKKLINLRNDLWNINRHEDDNISLMELELKDRKPFLDVNNTIEDINNLLEEYNVPYDFEVISQEEYQVMSNNEKNKYMKNLQNNPERRRKLMYWGKNNKDSETYKHSDDYGCPYCHNNNTYMGNRPHITIEQYSLPNDDDTDWHEDVFCLHCGNKFSIINGV